ncbi:hypothetical protein [Paraburkholderia sp. Ac-20347]|uniref:hypothetical protein n=1 Tax=Paraburkholderia sp. Ac-20347 TaxID=2703892 RepID=UPI0019803B9D|nr:hypothetical protein [Paraburkholderia sp. Ac-20347]MBN3808881.1 hypothetical protein [Paraburkholderia sp. Ac-20347]
MIPDALAKNGKSLTVHLSDFALRLLRELHALTGRTPFVLPHPKDSKWPVTTSVLQSSDPFTAEFRAVGEKEASAIR